MGKLLLFYLVYRLTGNPFLAILLLLMLYYFVDQRYIGLLPSLSKLFRRQARIGNLRRLLAANPHDNPAKYELAQVLMERGHYASALALLKEVEKSEAISNSADLQYDLGLCHLLTGDRISGKSLIFQAINSNPRVRYGEPYLKLAMDSAASNPTEALHYLEEFQKLNVSSCESYYRSAVLYRKLGDHATSAVARQTCLDTYHALPRFRKRVERPFAFCAWLLPHQRTNTNSSYK